MWCSGHETEVLLARVSIMGRWFLFHAVKRMAEMCEAERSKGKEGEFAERPLNAECNSVYSLLSC
jgi:hypothetical protein